MEEFSSKNKTHAGTFNLHPADHCCKKINDGLYILGISAFYHDSAAALIRDGQIVAAAQEEQFSRKKAAAP